MLFLDLGHTKLEIYPVIKSLAIEIYKITSAFPTHEKFGISSQIQRAAVSVVLNIAEGSARKSTAERLRFYEIARASLVELDAALSIAFALNYFNLESYPKLNDLIVTSFKKISLLIKSTKDILQK